METTQTPATPEHFLDVASRIGRRIAGQAQWEGEACTWQIMTLDRDHPDRRVAVPATAGSGIYEGTAGIGLFLAELNAVAPDEALARAAVGGVRYALADLPSETSFGFHGGRVGVAYAAARVGHLLKLPELVEVANDVLRPMAGQEREDRGVDVIAGGGGAIPALLRMTEWGVDAELAEGIARRLGDNLLESAEREPEGWGWGTMRGSAIRHLCGYAHGSAGVGHGLLELFHATGDGAYLYGAEQAFLYERHFYSPEHHNWPDLRHAELGEYLYSGRQQELRDRMLGGEVLPPQAPRYMAAWCHGAPGIALSRLRAWQLLGDPVYLEEAHAALAGTEASLIEEQMNFSACHGRGGNAESFIVAAEVLGEPAMLEVARRVAMQGWEAYESQGRPWPCGTMGGVSDPGLLLGEAGIGFFFLRLASPRTPSPLFVTAPGAPAREVREPGRYDEWRRRAVREHFGRTLAIFEGVGVDAAALEGTRGPGAAPLKGDAAEAHDRIVARIEVEAGAARRALLEDAFRLERERWALMLAVTDFSEEFLSNLTRPEEGEVRWPEARVELSPRARVVHSLHDWDAWLEAGASGAPEEEDTFHLLQASGRRVAVRRLSPFAALVLDTVARGATLDEVVDQVTQAVAGDGPGPDRGWVETRVVEQLRQAYRAGFVTAENGAVTAAA
ncbi:MAG TPA: lanthionine synthetase LanC family protein [Longimicrobium sp.]|nr:lanthionine synthetase LanC family protein [Longimicrobium sp.]